MNSYGKGLADPVDFSDLLREVNAVEGDFWVRFMTSHPKDCTQKLIDTIAQCPKVCNHIHLPVQSGSNRVLAAMNRRYTVESYLGLVDYARERIPGVTFSSDIIVGFPGETYEDFQQTLELVKRVRYTTLFTFIFSPRSGTRAAQMEDPIPAAEKSRWFRNCLTCSRGYAGNSRRPASEKRCGYLWKVPEEPEKATFPDGRYRTTLSNLPDPKRRLEILPM